jgi:hypothetical protein
VIKGGFEPAGVSRGSGAWGLVSGATLEVEKVRKVVVVYLVSGDYLSEEDGDVTWGLAGIVEGDLEEMVGGDNVGNVEGGGAREGKCLRKTLFLGV